MREAQAESQRLNHDTTEILRNLKAQPDALKEQIESLLGPGGAHVTGIRTQSAPAAARELQGPPR
ncbi:hypothetical protein BH09SUM1_BH09SUM1_23950 [soil metagenome]